MSWFRTIFGGVLAAVLLALGACGERPVLLEPGATPAGVGSRLGPGPGGAECYEGSFATHGEITLTASEMQFFAFSRNDCWPGTVHVQADLYWGVVSDCSQDVPKMINGYGSPDPAQNFYENPATQYLEVRRTHARPQGGIVKAKMVRTHRFWHYGYGPYGGPYTEITGETVACQAPSSAPLSVSVWGPTHVDTEGTYTYSASPSGGDQSYGYQWYVAYGGGTNWTALGTGSTQDVGVSQGQGDVQVRVVVTSAGQTAESQLYVQNSIGCGGYIIC